MSGENRKMGFTPLLRSRYEAFVTKNEDLVRKLQEVANILVFLLPGNTVDGELAQEAGLAAINLFVIYHNLLFAEKKKKALASKTGRRGGLAAARVAVRACRDSIENQRKMENIVNKDTDDKNVAGISNDTESLPVQETGTRSALRLALTVCAHTEVVAEMIAIRVVGDENKWPVVTIIEGLKSLARTWLLTNVKGPRQGEGGDTNTLNKLPRIQHHGCQYPTTNETLVGPFSGPPGSIPSAYTSSSSSESESITHGHSDPTEVMRRTMDYRHRYRQRWSNVLSASSTRHLSRELAIPTPQKIIQIGEILHIMRPLVYSLCRWRLGSEKWAPLLASGLMDFLSTSCTDIAAAVQAHLEGGGNGDKEKNPTIIVAVVQAIVGRHIWSIICLVFGMKKLPSSFVERQDAAMYELFSFDDRAEFNRRRSLWMYYFLRDPVFDRITRPAFGTVASVLSYIPLIGGLADYAMFSLEYYQKKHFWFSASSSGR
jgi:hypothetical protein